MQKLRRNKMEMAKQNHEKRKKFIGWFRVFRSL